MVVTQKCLSGYCIIFNETMILNRLCTFNIKVFRLALHNVYFLLLYQFCNF